jgi:hypothetical protein
MNARLLTQFAKGLNLQGVRNTHYLIQVVEGRRPITVWRKPAIVRINQVVPFPVLAISQFKAVAGLSFMSNMT